MRYHLHMPSYFLGTFTEYPYLSATEINPESPAKQAQEVLVDIQNFMNPDFNP